MAFCSYESPQWHFLLHVACITSSKTSPNPARRPPAFGLRSYGGLAWSLCILSPLVWNGEQDCAGGSDETECALFQNNSKLWFFFFRFWCPVSPQLVTWAAGLEVLWKVLSNANTPQGLLQFLNVKIELMKQVFVVMLPISSHSYFSH